jgi:succinoglycan biosynthesis transport protein ExoP
VSDEQATEGPLGQLGSLLGAVRRRWMLLAAIVIAAAVAAFVLSKSQTKKYDAISKVYIAQSNEVNALLGNGNTNAPDPERDFNSKVELITQPDVADRVRAQLHLSMSSDDLLKEVSTQVSGSSDVVGIQVEDTDPARAAAIANSFAKQYITVRQSAVRGAILQAANLAQRQLNSLAPVDRNGPQGRALAQRLRELQIDAALQTGGIEPVSNATRPTGPSSPKPTLMTVIAAFLGGILGLILVIALELLDRRIKEIGDIERYGRPVLAAIPAPATSSSPLDEEFAVREALSTLATNLRFLNLGRDVNSIVITSPGPQEGKTSVALGLSRGLTELGLRVVTIEADLRRPLFTTYTSLGAGNGLSTVLAGVTDLDEALVDVDAHTLRPLGPGDSHDTPYFTVLPAGPVPPNPLGLLSNPQMAQTVKRLRAMADVVVIDTAPVGTVNDAVAIAELVDGILLLAKLGQTRRDAFERTVRTFDHLPTPLLGLILTNAPRGSAGSYYGYDRPYRAARETELA